MQKILRYIDINSRSFCLYIWTSLTAQNAIKSTCIFTFTANYFKDNIAWLAFRTCLKNHTNKIGYIIDNLESARYSFYIWYCILYFIGAMHMVFFFYCANFEDTIWHVCNSKNIIRSTETYSNTFLFVIFNY